MFSQSNQARDEQYKTEKDNFLESSYHFKQLKKIHNRMKTEDDKKVTSSWVDAIEKAKDLYDVLYATRDLDPEHTDTLLVYQLGRNKWNALLFIGGYASDRINFNYHLLHLRESIQTHMDNTRKSWWRA